MKKERKPESFLRKPTYKGGPKAMRAFIGENLKYPPAARAAGIEGTVRLRIDISHQGKVTAAKVLSSLGHGCDEEAVRVVQLLRFEIPKLRKLRAVFHKTINIHFRLAANDKENPSTGQIQYTISPSKTSPKQEADQDDAPEGGGYEYTISW